MGEAADEIVVKDNPKAQRFEAHLDEGVAMAEYQLDENAIRFTHTHVPVAASGQGVGSKLAQACLQSARERGLQVVPLCSFIAGYIDRHPEYKDLVAPEFR